MGQALYRRYRSKKLSELVGQEHITTALNRALTKGTIGHAYLFTGPRGTGKTSVARILAHEVNGLPYGDETNHLDIIEIDAASNRRIDEIRDLRDKVHVAPTSAKYKVYIIDEVHMLTREAFNALLKTLEEPPAHVIFILATTEVHKLPETIISRTQRFSFKPVELKKVIAHLKTIAKQEKIQIDDEALQLIAEHGEGSFRDSISLLDQVRNTGEKVTLTTVQQLLGIAPEALLEELLAAVSAHDGPATVKSLQALQEQGYSAPMTAKQLGRLLRTRIIDERSPFAPNVTLGLLARLVNVPASADPRISLEIALLDIALSGVTATPKSQPSEHKATPKPGIKAMHEDVRAKPATQIEPHPSTFQKTSRPDPVETKPLDGASWNQIIAAIKQQYNTLYSIVRAVRPVFGANEVTLECGFAFHKKRLSESRNKQIIADTIHQVTGQEPTIQFALVENLEPPKNETPVLPPADEQIHNVAGKEPPKDNQAVKTISNIFGGAELLES